MLDPHQNTVRNIKLYSWDLKHVIECRAAGKEITQLLPKYDHHTEEKLLKLRPLPTIVDLEDNTCDEVPPLKRSEVAPVEHLTLEADWSEKDE